jgi:hypothetical protein
MLYAVIVLAVLFAGILFLISITTSGPCNQDARNDELPVARGEASLTGLDSTALAGAVVLSGGQRESLIGTWIKERSMKEGGQYPGDNGWHLSVTFADDGRFIWDSQRSSDDHSPVDESVTGTYSIERGFLIAYHFDQPSPVAREVLPEYFAFWPSELTGRQTFKCHGESLILGHDEAKLWFFLKRSDDSRSVVLLENPRK